MSMEGLIVVVVMFIVGAVVIVQPFAVSRYSVDRRKRQIEMSRDELITSYERVLATLRDLEDDFKTQKMHAEDYEREKTYWSQYGVKLLQLLDGTTVDDNNVIPSFEMELDQSVEEAIHNYRVALQSTNNE